MSNEIRPILLIQGATRATARQITITGATLTDNGGGSVDLAISGGGGGGGLWTASGYTGTANYGAGFNGSGAAALIDLSLYLTVTTAAATYQPLDAGLTSLLGQDGAAGLLYTTGAATWARAALGDLAVSGASWEVTQARGLLETGGPTTLAMGAVADGELLSRDGTTVSGVSVGAGLRLAGGDLTLQGGSNTDFNAAYGRVFWLQPVGAGVQVEGTTVSYGAGAPTDGTTTTGPVANFSASGSGGGKSMLTGANVRMGFGGTLYVRFTVDVVSNVRYFFALTAGGTGATPPPANCVGLVFDPGLSANWRMVGTNTPSTNVTYKDLGVAPLANKVYLLTISTTLTTAEVVLENLTDTGSVSATIDTALGEYLPSTASSLLFNLAVVSISGTAKVIGFRGAQYRAEYSS